MDQYDDRIDTLTRGFLGLTVACARCHDHKFDPISTARLLRTGRRIRQHANTSKSRWCRREEVEAADKVARATTEKEEARSKKYPFIHALKDAEKPVTMRVHIRGNADNLGDEVAAAVPVDSRRRMSRRRSTHGSGRLELAEAIASRGQPAHRARDGQPHLEAPLWRGAGPHGEQLRHAGRAADASRAARLPGRAVHGVGLVDQGAAPRDHALGGVSAVAAASTRRRRRSIPRIGCCGG